MIIQKMQKNNKIQYECKLKFLIKQDKGKILIIIAKQIFLIEISNKRMMAIIITSVVIVAILISAI